MDNMRRDIWRIPPIPSNNRFLTCQKPAELLKYLFGLSTNDGRNVVIYGFSGRAATDHTSIVESVTAYGVVAIESNTSQARN